MQLTASYCNSLQGVGSIRIYCNVGHLVMTCIYLHQPSPFVSHLLSHTLVGQTLSVRHQVLRRQAHSSRGMRKCLYDGANLYGTQSRMSWVCGSSAPCV